MRVPEAGVPERCPPRLLGLDDAAAYLGVKRGVVRDLIDTRKLPRIALCRRVLIDRRDLDTLIDRSRETSS
jgi:excisionase family DNA binding protein